MYKWKRYFERPRYHAGTENGAYLCTNNGTSWTPLGFSSEVFSIAVSGIQIYAGTEYGGVYLYNNNTANWTPVDSGLFAWTIYSLAVKGSDIYAGTGEGLYLSNNNATNWTPVDSVFTLFNGTPLIISGFGFSLLQWKTAIFLQELGTVFFYQPIMGQVGVCRF